MAGAAADRERAVRDLEVYVLAREDGHLWGEARASRLCPGGEQSVKPDADATERGAAQPRAAVPCGYLVHFKIPRRPNAVRRALSGLTHCQGQAPVANPGAEAARPRPAPSHCYANSLR